MLCKKKVSTLKKWKFYLNCWQAFGTFDMKIDMNFPKAKNEKEIGSFLFSEGIYLKWPNKFRRDS